MKNIMKEKERMKELKPNENLEGNWKRRNEKKKLNWAEREEYEGS